MFKCNKRANYQHSCIILLWDTYLKESDILLYYVFYKAEITTKFEILYDNNAYSKSKDT